MKPTRAYAAAAAVAIAVATIAVLRWQGLQGQPGAGLEGPTAGGTVQPTGSAASNRPAAGPLDGGFFAARRSTPSGAAEDPLLVHGLRDTLEALLTEAGESGDPAALKQRLAGLVGRYFPAELATRALALAERYVDYRVALGELRAPQDALPPHALRDALEARHKVRQQFFDGDEYGALFAREDDLDRYTVARLEIARNAQLSAEQRAQALRDTENELPEARRAERAAATAHLGALAQTATFDAQHADERTRHAVRSAQYGEAAAHAMAQLDREEQDWQRRLDQYSQARAQQGEGAPLQRLRQQLFSAEEQQRIDAALALRRLLPAASSGS